METTGELVVVDSDQLNFESSPTFAFSVSVTKAGGGSDEARIVVQLANVNEAPTISVPPPINISEDTSLLFGSTADTTISIADQDVAAGNVKVILTATAGTIEIAAMPGLRYLGSASGSQLSIFGQLADINTALGGLRFKPATDFFGQASLRITASDLGNSGIGVSQTDDEIIEINVAAVNDPPIFDPIADMVMFEDSLPVSLSITGIQAGPTNEAGQTVTLSAISSNPDLIATPVVSGSGSTRQLVLTPESNANGTATITVTAIDDGGTSGEGAGKFSRQFSVTVRSVIDPPDLADDLYQIDEDNSLEIDAPGVLGNDTTDDVVVATLLVAPSRGDLALNADGSFRYTPNQDAFGEDSFVYRATDSTGASGTATARVIVRPINDAPVAHEDDVITLQDSEIVIDVLANDLDVDGALLANTVRVLNDSSRGVSAIDAITGQVTYVPDAGFVGSDSLTYEVCDDGEPSACGVASVHIEVRRLNHAPLAVNDSATTSEQIPVAINVLANDLDQDGDLLTVIGFSQGAHGAVAISSDGLIYTPGQDFYGNDTFTYVVSDNHNQPVTAKVHVEILPINDVPQAVSETYYIRPNVPFTLVAPGVLANDSDADGDRITASLVSDPSFGRVELHEDGSFVYAATVGGQLQDSFTYVTTDGFSTSAVATVEIIVVAETVEIVDSESCNATRDVIGNESNPSAVPYGQFGALCIIRPSTDAGGPYSIQEGDSLALAGSAMANSNAEPFDFSWDVNVDGVFADAVGAEPQLTWQQLRSLGVDDDGIFRIRLRTNDAIGNARETSAVLVVSNTDPTVSLQGADQIEEGSQYTLSLGTVTDPGDDTVTSFTVNWGDGTSNVYDANGAVTHSYREGPLDHEITIDVVDEDGLHSTVARLPLTVQNVAPQIVDLNLVPSAIEKGGTVTLAGEFSDPGALDTHQVVIEWGDGTVDTLIDLNVDQRTFTANHRYPENSPAVTDSGGFTIVVTVKDDDAGEASATANVTVVGNNPTDVTDHVTINLYGRQYNRRTGVYGFYASITNNSTDDLAYPIRLLFSDLGPTGTTVVNADGVLDDGTPYFDFEGTGLLAPGMTTTAVVIGIKPPPRMLYTFELQVFAVVVGGSRAAGEWILDGADSFAAIPSPAFQNRRDRFDVNADGRVSSQDALAVINHIHRGRNMIAADLAAVVDLEPRKWLDVNGDGIATALDALNVINELGRREQRKSFEVVHGEQIGKVENVHRLVDEIYTCLIGEDSKWLYFDDRPSAVGRIDGKWQYPAESDKHPSETMETIDFVVNTTADRV